VTVLSFCLRTGTTKTKFNIAAVFFVILIFAGAAPAADVPLFSGLGVHHRTVTTVFPEAQRYFDQGLNFLYAFNHDEAIRSFQKAGELDPSCAMAWWGVAVANGPHINYPVVPPDRAKAAWEALAKAKSAPNASPVERALVDALNARYADPQPEDRSPLDKSYADALRKVRAAHPKDADVGALFAEALMDLSPWNFYAPDGQPLPGTPEILKTLEDVLKQSPKHPLALHLFIHAVELSPHPEKADAAAERLRDLTPGLGHLVHMPSHIDVRLGRWEKAIATNAKAEEADRLYREQSTEPDFYRFYMAHNHHMRAFAAMMIGRSAEAVAAMDRLVAEVPEDWGKKNAGVIDGFLSMPLEARLRFGMWDEVLKFPTPDPVFPIARAMRHFARGVAFAAMDRVAEARASEAAFLVGRWFVRKDATFGNNLGPDVLRVALGVLRGEILYREGRKQDGIDVLGHAVVLEDGLRYDEPPDWIHPVRHALGAVLLQEGRFAEAEKVFREDLEKLPGNGWSLFGLGQSLRGQGRDADAVAVEARFRKAWATADYPLTSPCACQAGNPMTRKKR
jgi:tetratricopeptide (TPR) repeat protein